MQVQATFAGGLAEHLQAAGGANASIAASLRESVSQIGSATDRLTTQVKISCAPGFRCQSRQVTFGLVRLPASGEKDMAQARCNQISCLVQVAEGQQRLLKLAEETAGMHLRPSEGLF